MVGISLEIGLLACQIREMAPKTANKRPPKLPKMMSAAQLALAFGVSVGTVYGWSKRGILRKTSGGKYNLEDCRRRKALWDEKQVAAREKQREDAEAGVVPQGLPANMLAAYENSNLLRVRTQHERLRLKRAEGQLIDRRAINQAVGATFSMLRGQLRSLGDQLSPLLVGLESIDEIRAVIDAQVERLLARLSATQVLETATGAEEPPAHH
jgi:phage terminase Nu1 subunit (DNA packaging protein)